MTLLSDTQANSEITYKPGDFNKKLLLTFVSWLLFILVGGVGAIYININNLTPNILLETYSTEFQPILRNEKSFYLYQDTKDNSLLWFGIFYVFTGKIKDITPIPEGNQITLAVDDAVLPQFIVDSNTKFFFGYNHFNYSGMGTSADLKQNLNVRLVTYYSLSRQKWLLTEVYIPEAINQ